MPRLLPAAATLAALMAFAAPAGADHRHAHHDHAHHDHDRARQALEAGEVLPLRTILERVEREHAGQVMEVGLEREAGRWIYDLRLLRPGGALVRLQVDAGDGRPLAATAERRR